MRKVAAAAAFVTWLLGVAALQLVYPGMVAAGDKPAIIFAVSLFVFWNYGGAYVFAFWWTQAIGRIIEREINGP